MSEWLKEHAWKACVGETLPWVRIPLSPPAFAHANTPKRELRLGKPPRRLSRPKRRRREGGLRSTHPPSRLIACGVARRGRCTYLGHSLSQMRKSLSHSSRDTTLQP